jgi:hypothetical protein
VKLWHGPCGDPYCSRGASGSGFAGGAGYYRDGPCNSVACEWPIGYVSPHKQPIPAKPIVDAGKEALVWVKTKHKPYDPKDGF